MDARTVCAAVLLTAGVAVLLLAVLALQVLPGPYARLHALSPATSLGAPLVLLALAVAEGSARRAAPLLVVAVLVGVGGALTAPALGRCTAQHEGRIPRKDPP
ncbi:monovalent cation/H(+) antiporter subunit G [Streptomyces sp. SKN60]|uniref:monovalent cation/H(+) antiporter subunit G n=1 Tax=Streptomyces sp. SKN60 TaxID=2855506 RepID=UPI0022472A11|nr:monovalent cation/H(+) antiporter subunit G [Streptomyces sp. SKN60]